MKFAFDKLSSLVGVKLPSKKERERDPTKKTVIDSPFQGLEIAENGDTITIHTKPQNPAEKVKAEASEQGPKTRPETEKMMNDAFKNMRVALEDHRPVRGGLQQRHAQGREHADLGVRLREASRRWRRRRRSWTTWPVQVTYQTMK